MNNDLVNSSRQVSALNTARSNLNTMVNNLNAILSVNESTSTAIDEIITKAVQQKKDCVNMINDIDSFISSVNRVTRTTNSLIRESNEADTYNRNSDI